MVYNSAGPGLLLEYFSPGICYLCQDYTCRDATLCDQCRRDLPRGQNRYLDPIFGPQLIDQIITAFKYQFPVNVLIRQLKYQQKLLLAKELGRELALNRLKVSAPLPECIIPVPLHKQRYLYRGYNQALEIALVVAQVLALPVDVDLLARARNTAAQFALTPKQRKQNLRGAFRLRTMPAYTSVALVDDVITSGSTVNELAGLLKRSGVTRVEAWACASAEH